MTQASSFRWADASRTVVLGPRGLSFPADLGCTPYAELVASGAAIDDPVSIVTADDVRAEAGRRIVAVYPLFRQVNVILSGDGDAIQHMAAFIGAIRAKSNVLELMPVIPLDFAEDAWWEATT